MNITDVDDKIILRARQRHLFAQYKNNKPTIDADVIQTLLTAWNAYVAKNLPLVPANTTTNEFQAASQLAYKNVIEDKSLDGTSAPTEVEAKIKMHLRTAQSAAEGLNALNGATPASSEVTYAKVEDVMLPYLDGLYGAGIDSKDHTMFLALTEEYTRLFFEDMAALNVLPATKITKVTDYIPHINEFVEKIMDNGFAYQTASGVYFDIEAFTKAGNRYGVLLNQSGNTTDLIAEAEGSLSHTKSGEKRSKNDFALIKQSKPGEPAWHSDRWGDARPGWHIECSAMASSEFAESMDIHSGGQDLCLHHQNEVAQSEAYFAPPHGVCGSQWVHMWLHMGHLSISGMKMSKSLKNFTTIRDALTVSSDGIPAWTSRMLRITLLLTQWNAGVEITVGLVELAKAQEDKIHNFFLKSLDIEASFDGTVEQGSSPLFDALKEAKAETHTALCDSFNTQGAMQAISSLITQANTIFSNDPTESDKAAILASARWITRMVTIFGLNGDATLDTVNIGWEGITIPAPAQPIIYRLSKIRDEIRTKALQKAIVQEEMETLVSEPSPAKPNGENDSYIETFQTFQKQVKDVLDKKEGIEQDLLRLCDSLRDTVLWDQDIYLEDREGLPALVRPVDSNMRVAKAAKDRAIEEKRLAKEQRAAEEAAKKAALAEKAKVSPEEMYKTAEFSEWDENGIPTKAANGDEITKSRRKKLEKDQKAQGALHKKWLAEQK